MAEASIHPDELARIYSSLYQGRRVEFLLCNDTTGLDPDATTAEWLAMECTGGGYERHVVAALGGGTYDSDEGVFASDVIPVEFTGSGAGYSYSHMVIVMYGATDPLDHPYAIVDMYELIPVSVGQIHAYPTRIIVGGLQV